mgnify:CR=1 FL=1
MKKEEKVKRNQLLVFFALSIAIVLFLFAHFISTNFYAFKLKISGFAIFDENLLANLFIPSAITSIIFSIVGIFVILLLIVKIKSKGPEKAFPFFNYVAAVGIIFVIFLINYFITLFPYGNMIVNVISFILQIMVYGVLLPYILVAQIDYIFLLFKGNIRMTLK